MVEIITNDHIFNVPNIVELTLSILHIYTFELLMDD